MGRVAKESVAIAVRDGDGRLLIVRRAEDDESLPGAWGLPGASRRAGESLVEAAARAARDKLGVEVRVGRHLGDDEAWRDGRGQRLSEFEAEVVAGEPSVPQADRSVSQYTALRWTSDPSELRPAAVAGSLCGRIYLRHVGLTWA